MNNPRCSNCEWANPPGTAVCQRCGAQLGFAPPAIAPAQSAYYPPPPPQKSGPSKKVIAAIVIGGLLVVSVPVIGIVAAIAIPSLLAARRASNESAAVGNLRTLGSAEAVYLADEGKSATISELKAKHLLDGSWTENHVRDGYRIRQVKVDPNDQTFEFSAEPVNASNGSKSFNIVEDFVVRYTSGTTAPKGSAGKQIGQ